MELTLHEAAEKLRQADRIVLTAHEHPDGDAVGSTMGLMYFLQSLGKQAQVILEDKVSKNLHILPGAREVRQLKWEQEIAEKAAEEAAEKAKAEPGSEKAQENPAVNAGEKKEEWEPEPVEADLLVILDTSADRIGRVKDVVKAAAVINIDHHITNQEKELPVYVDGQAAACAEILFELIREMGGDFSKNLPMAQCIYTGLATDTGFFRFSNTTAHTMHAAAELLAAGVEPNVISEALEVKPYEDIMSLAKAMEHIELLHDGRGAGVFLDYETMQELRHTDGIVDMVRVIEGIDIAVVMKEKVKDNARVSMRSTGLDVSAVAKKFGGGGHVRAAGCGFRNTPFETAKAKLLSAVDAALDAYVPGTGEEGTPGNV